MAAETSESSSPPELPDLSGHQVGHYRLGRRIGSGGMGVVYEATNDHSSQRVAFKTLLAPQPGEVKSRERFWREARACAQLEHEGLVRIYDCAETPDGMPYIVMELLVGDTLRVRLNRQGSFDASTALLIAWQLARALTVAHERKIVHRDLKPENIMLVRNEAGEERTKLLDFGIAKFMADTDMGTLQTNTTKVLGTPTYMSPEQCQCAEEVDAKSDVYSLGVVLYEMLCGQPPFRATGTRVLHMHVHQDPPSPLSFCPGLNVGIVDLLEQMLEKRAKKRPSMAQVSAELDRLRSSPTTLSRMVWQLPRRGRRVVYRLRHLQRRIPRWAYGVVLVIAAWNYWNSESSWPYIETPFFPHANEHEAREKLKTPKGGLFFHKTAYIKDYVDAHADIHIAPDGVMEITAYSASTHIFGAHIPGGVGLFDSNNQRLELRDWPLCGVGASRKFFGYYDDQHPRVCHEHHQLDPSIVSKIHHARILMLDRYQYYIGEYLRSEEGRNRLMETSQLLPVAAN